MVIEKLKTLKNQSNITITELSNLSGIPETTIRRIFSGETPDPRFDTVFKLVTAMGGSLDEFVGASKKMEIESNVITSLKELYETRLNDVKDHYKFLIDSLQRDKHILAVVVAVLLLFLVGLIILELSIPNHGWIQY